jgi:hypothetical protein
VKVVESNPTKMRPTRRHNHERGHGSAVPDARCRKVVDGPSRDAGSVGFLTALGVPGFGSSNFSLGARAFSSADERYTPCRDANYRAFGPGRIWRSAAQVLVGIVVTATLNFVLSPPLTYAQYQAPSSLQGKTIVIPIGTTFEGRIDSTIGSSISRQGERFVISTSSPVLANGVDVLIPAGAEVMGEVVEAVPAKKVPHQKYQIKPIGKLRVQLTALRMPDGLTFPLIASIIPDKMTARGGNQQRPLGTGVAYVGSQANFEVVAPGNPQYNRARRGTAPKVVSPSDVLKDPILGRDQLYANNGNPMGGAIRSLVRKHNDLYIYSGSPISMRIDAPFKLSFSSAQGAASALNAPPTVAPDQTGAQSGKRFIKDGAAGDANDAANVPQPAATGGTANTTTASPPLNGGPVGQNEKPAKKHDNNDSEF